MKLKNTIFFVLILIATNTFASNAVSRGPYGFIENKGQVVNQNHQPNKEVLYLYNGRGLHVQLRQNGFSYEVIKTERSLKEKLNIEIDPAGKSGQDSFDYTYKIHRIDILFEDLPAGQAGGNKNANIAAYGKSLDYLNYYTAGTAQAGISDVHHYQKIVYTNIYPNIDVEFVLTNDSLKPFKYNFIVHPNGNINDIKLRFLGATGTTLTDDGHISIVTAYGNIDESIPYSYQLNSDKQQREIESGFVFISPNLFGISANNYDATQTLVIDPAPWATYFGGNNTDWGFDIKTDLSGNLLLTGHTFSATGIATSGAYQTILSGNTDAYIAKLSNAGIPLWCTYFGGLENDYCRAVGADANGNVIIVGYTLSDANIATSGAYQTTRGGSQDAYIAKFSSLGALQWATYYGGSLNEYAYGVSIDLNNNIILTGLTFSTSDIATTGAYQTVLGGTQDVFVVKFNTSGVLQWGSYYGGSSQEFGYQVVTDLNGNIVLTGNTQSTTGIATSGAWQTTAGGGFDAYIAKFNASGTLQWSTFFGGSGTDYGTALVCDPSGNIFATGFSSSSTAIATAGAWQTINAGNNDVYIAKFNPSGVVQWSTYYGGPSSEYGYSITNDVSGNLYICGYTASSSGIATSGAYQTVIGGINDAIVAKFNGAGILQWGTYFGGSSAEVAYGICKDLNNGIFTTGYTGSTSGIATSGAWQTVNAGSNDAFIFFIPPPVVPVITNNTISTSQGICTGNVPATLNGSTPGGGIGTYVYSWLSSTTSASAGFSPASGINNAINYSPPVLSADIWYKRAVISGTYFDTSNVVMITVGKPVTSPITGNTTVTVFSSNNYSVVPTTGSTYQWIFNNASATITNNTIILSWNIVGPTVLKLVETATGGCRGDTVYLNINVVPASGVINTISADQSICTGAVPQTLIGSVPGAGGPYVYSWLSSTTNATTGFGLANGINNTINYSPPALPANTWYKRAVGDAGVFDTSNIVVITVGATQLHVGFTVNKLIQCINSNNFIFTDTTTSSSGPITRLWDFGDGVTSTLVNPTYSYTFHVQNGYWVRLVSSINGGCTDSARQRVILNTNPITGSIAGNTIVDRNSTNTYIVPARSGSSYRWFVTNGTGSSTTNSINIKWNAVGTVDLKVIETSGGGCLGDTVYQRITINPAAGLDGFETNNDINIYPNPSSGQIHISSSQNGQMQINVFDMRGKIVQHARLYHEDDLIVDLNSLQNGIYSVQVINENGSSCIKKIQLIK